MRFKLLVLVLSQIFTTIYAQTASVDSIPRTNTNDGMDDTAMKAHPTVMQLNQADKKILGPVASNYEWWNEARYGVFIHWTVASLLELGGGSWFRENPQGKYKGMNKTQDTIPEVIKNGSYKKWRGKSGVPMEIYDNLHHIFNPTRFDAKEWVKFFKDSGIKYVVLTTKHHDGFCMFDTKTTDFKITNTPFKRDVCKELADACHEAGLKVIWYFSVADWYAESFDGDNPKPYWDYMTEQVRELCTNYGDIAGFWWDGGGKYPTNKKDVEALHEMIQGYFPNYITNGRMGKSVPGLKFSTPEQRIGQFNMKSPWETCANVQGMRWFWDGGHNIKSVRLCTQMLISSAGGDGNLLLDFGPKPDGTIHEPIKDVYRGMGEWLKSYGHTIYSTRGGPYEPGRWGVSTRKDNKVYLHITQIWPSGELKLPPVGRKIISYKSLTGGTVQCQQTPENLIIRMPQAEHDPVATIIELILDGPAIDIQSIPTLLEIPSLTMDCKATASSHAGRSIEQSVISHSFEAGHLTKYFGEGGEFQKEGSSGSGKQPEVTIEGLTKADLEAVAKRSRGSIRRFWQPDMKQDKQPWLMVDLGKPKTFNRIHIRERFSNIKAFKIETKTTGAWETLHEGTFLEGFSLQLMKPVTAQWIRLTINKWSETPYVYEFDVYDELVSNLAHKN
jgi:alpha-L-fucosidase